MSRSGNDIVNSASTLSPLPLVLHRGLTAVAVFGSISLVSSCCLFASLIIRIVTCRDRFNCRITQFMLLITNLIWADIQQSIAFALNAIWVFRDAVRVETDICLAQGWFISTGNMASGMFTLAIAVHCFTDIILGYRVKHRWFLLWVLGLWMFVYAFAAGGMLAHINDDDPYYARAGAWCWVNKSYIRERLWLHYFWLIASEFGTALVYATTITILRRRIRNGRYFLNRTQKREAEVAVRSMIWYPLVYCVCTLPLVIVRLHSMSGGQNTFVGLCVAGSIITSCGTLDVLLFLMTRRSVLDMVGDNAGILTTFATKPWYCKDKGPFGTTTTITAAGPAEDEKEVHTKSMVEEDIWSGDDTEHVKSRLTLERRHTYGPGGEVTLTTLKTIDIRSEVMQEKDQDAILRCNDMVRSKAVCPTSKEELMLEAQMSEMNRIGSEGAREARGRPWKSVAK